MLHLLPSLATIAITPLLHQQSKEQRFSQLRRIWMWPSFRGLMQNKIRIILPAFNNFSNITKLEIGGTFQPYCPSVRLSHIQSLHIDCLELLRGLEREFVCFLSAFPMVKDLSIMMKRGRETEFIPMHELSFPLLRSFRIEGLVVTETSMLDFMIAQLMEATITLLDDVLQRGSWNGLARGLRQAGRFIFFNNDGVNNPSLAKPRPCHHSLYSCPTCRDADSAISGNHTSSSTQSS